MTDDELRELDRWCAEVVMGWQLLDAPGNRQWLYKDMRSTGLTEHHCINSFSPSSDIRSTQLLKHQLVKDGWYCKVCVAPWGEVRASFEKLSDERLERHEHTHGFDGSRSVDAETEPLAVCLAAKKLMEAEANLELGNDLAEQAQL